MTFAAMTTLYSVSHFAVDFACAFFVFSFVSTPEMPLALLAYNFCAFALQMPLGALLDGLGGDRRAAALGAVLVACGLFLGGSAFGLCVVIGLGNALFHIGAGRAVLERSAGRLTALGAFVSPGAIGLFFGSFLARQGGLAPFIVSAVLLILAVLMFILPRKLTETAPELEKRGDGTKTPVSGKLLIFGVAALFAVVIIRSLTGMTLTFPWKQDTPTALSLVLALALGKVAGGVLADRFGLRLVSGLSLSLAALLFCFSFVPVAGLAAVFFFNMTMPITLGAISRAMPERLGFGFGTLTLAIYIGALPVLTGLITQLPMPLGAVGACLLSLALLEAALWKRPRLSRRADDGD